MTSDKTTIRGRTRITFRDALTGEVLEQMPWKENLVTDDGEVLFAELMGGLSTDYITHCAVGSDGTAANEADGSLGAEIGRLPITDISISTSTLTFSTFFGSADCNGAWNEVGLLTGAAGGVLVCRNVLASEFTKNTTKTATIDYEVEVA